MNRPTDPAPANFADHITPLMVRAMIVDAAHAQPFDADRDDLLADLEASRAVAVDLFDADGFAQLGIVLGDGRLRVVGRAHWSAFGHDDGHDAVLVV